MAYRTACEASGRIAALGVLAGSDALDAERCVQDRPLSIVHVHGRGDLVIRYEGGTLEGARYPGVEEVLSRWATRAGCELAARESDAPRDVDAFFEGNESDVLRYARGCAPGVEIEHWRNPRGGHIRPSRASFTTQWVDWLLARRRERP